MVSCIVESLRASLQGTIGVIEKVRLVRRGERRTTSVSSPVSGVGDEEMRESSASEFGTSQAQSQLGRLSTVSFRKLQHLDSPSAC